MLIGFRNPQCRPQWPGGLRDELSSPAQTLGSCFRITLETWMSARVSSAFVLSCVGSGLATDHPSKESYQPSIRSIVPDTF
jgi:hypothetical protein